MGNSIISTSVLIVCFFSMISSASGTCGGLQGDVVFVLDASGSVGSSNFQMMLQFVNDLVNDFDIGGDLVQVGVVKYASSVYTEFHLHDDHNTASMQSTISSIYYTGGGTLTAEALEHTRTVMFTAANGDRSNIPNIAIVITDGLSNTDPTTEAALARAAGITIFSIGVGTGVTELNNIASDPDSDHVFTVSTFSGLTSIQAAFQTKACNTNTFVTNVTVIGSTSNSTSTSTGSEDSGSGSTAAIVGGVVGGVAALGIAGAAGGIIYSKMTAGKTAIQTVNQVNVERGLQQSKQKSSEPTEPEISIPGMINAPASIQPMDTRWPARLPPIRI